MVDNLLSLEMFMLSHTAQVCDTCHVALNLLREIQWENQREGACLLETLHPERQETSTTLQSEVLGLQWERLAEP